MATRINRACSLAACAGDHGRPPPWADECCRTAGAFTSWSGSGSGSEAPDVEGSSDAEEEDQGVACNVLMGVIAWAMGKAGATDRGAAATVAAAAAGTGTGICEAGDVADATVVVVVVVVARGPLTMSSANPGGELMTRRNVGAAPCGEGEGGGMHKQHKNQV